MSRKRPARTRDISSPICGNSRTRLIRASRTISSTTLGSVACALAIVGCPSSADASLMDSPTEAWKSSCSRPSGDILKIRIWPDATR